MPSHSRLPNSILRPASWPKTSLIRNGTPRKGPSPSVVSSSGFRQFLRRDLFGFYQLRQAERVVFGVFANVHLSMITVDALALRYVAESTGSRGTRRGLPSPRSR